MFWFKSRLIKVTVTGLYLYIKLAENKNSNIEEILQIVFFPLRAIKFKEKDNPH